MLQHHQEDKTILIHVQHLESNFMTSHKTNYAFQCNTKKSISPKPTTLPSGELHVLCFKFFSALMPTDTLTRRRQLLLASWTIWFAAPVSLLLLSPHCLLPCTGQTIFSLVLIVTVCWISGLLSCKNNRSS